MASRSLGTLTLDLIAKVGGFVEGMSKAERASDNAARKILREQKRMTDKVDKAYRRLSSSLSSFKGLLATGFAVAGVVQFTRKLVDANVEMQRIHFTLSQVFGDRGAGRQFKFVAGLAQELGLNLRDAAEGYAKLAAAAQGTEIQTKTIQKVFTGLSESATVLHASTEEVNGVFTQLAQAMSLGKLQMVDIRAISQHLPGTMTLLSETAKRMGTTLTAALKSGGLEAKKFLDIFGDVLHERFGEEAVKASHNLNAEINRLHTSIFTLLTQGNEFEQSAARAIAQVTAALNSSQFRQAVSSILTDFGKFLANAASNIPALIAHMREIISTVKDVAIAFATLFVAKKVAGAIRLMVDAFIALKAAVLFLGGPLSIIIGLVTSVAAAAAAVIIHSRNAGAAAEAYAKKQMELNAALRNTINLQKATSVQGALQNASEINGKLAEQKNKLDELRKTLDNINAAPAGDVSANRVIRVNAKIEKAQAAVKLLEQRYQEAQANLKKLQAQQPPAKINAPEVVLPKVTAPTVRGGKKVGESYIDSVFEGAQEAIARMQQKSKQIASDLLHALFPKEALSKDFDQQVAQIYDVFSDPSTRAKYLKAAAQQYGDHMRNLVDQTKTGTDQMSEFAKQASRNMQDAFAEFLFDPFDKGIKGLLGNFIDMLRKMAAQALASRILNGIGAGSGESGSGWFGQLINLVSSTGKAMGGTVGPYSFQRVNERGPELLSVGGNDYLMMGAQGGVVTPNNRLSGGSTIINVAVQPTSTRRTAEQVATAVARKQRIATSRNN